MRPGEGILTLQRTVEGTRAGNPGKEPKIRGKKVKALRETGSVTSSAGQRRQGSWGRQEPSAQTINIGQLCSFIG